MSSVRVFKTESDEETRAIGRHLASVLPQSGLVLLIGELGAGKTTLTKGIVEGRGAETADNVTSPTFTLIHECGVPPSVYHIDLYRLDTVEEVRGLGIDELLDSPALVLIEWGERFPNLWPADHTQIRIQTTGDSSREITISFQYKP